MLYKVHIDDFDRDYWEQCAARFSDHSIYQTWPYQQIRGEMDGQQISRALVEGEDGRIAAMCQVRIKKIRLLGVTIGYVQWGPLVRAEDGTITCSTEALQALRDAYVGVKVDVLRLVPNVCDNSDGERMKQMLTAAGFCKPVSNERYHTFMVRVDDSEEAVRSRLSKSFRRNLKKAEKAGIQMHHRQDERACDILEELYAASLRRKGFKGLVLRPFVLAQSLLSKPEKMDMIVTYCNGEPASIHVTSHLGDTSIALFAASNEAGLSSGSAYLIWYEAVITAFRRGMKWCDLCGIDPDHNPNVFEFKARMGGEEVYHVGAFEAYSSLWTRALWRASDNIYGLFKKWVTSN